MAKKAVVDEITVEHPEPIQVFVAKGTEIELNGLQISLDEDLTGTLVGVTTYDQAAELCNVAGIDSDFTHYEEIDGKDVCVTYGQHGERIVE